MWTKDRREELKKLQALLNEAKLINSGSDVIGKMLHIISTAEELTYFDIKTPRDSFLQFLIYKAMEEEKLTEKEKR